MRDTQLLGANNIKYFVQLALISFVLGCSNQGVATLTEEPTINDIFTATEVQDLATILDFFENKIYELQQVDKQKTHDCYQSFFLKMKKQEETGEFDSKISFEE